MTEMYTRMKAEAKRIGFVIIYKTKYKRKRKRMITSHPEFRMPLMKSR